MSEQPHVFVAHIDLDSGEAAAAVSDAIFATLDAVGEKVYEAHGARQRGVFHVAVLSRYVGYLCAHLKADVVADALDLTARSLREWSAQEASGAAPHEKRH